MPDPAEASSGGAEIISIAPSLRAVSHNDFKLSQVQRGVCDKLGNRIDEILWLSPHYAVYRTDQGIFIHFSDDKAVEKQQREAYTTICPELCELRYLTGDMHGSRPHPITLLGRLFGSSAPPQRGHSLFDHNIAQALMLLMEEKQEDAKKLATAALGMAVSRSTNDNTIRYIMAAGLSALVLAGSLLLFKIMLPLIAGPASGEVTDFLVAALYGILGASFSIITRIQSFKMKPSHQSNMNYWMAFVRIMIGLIGGLSFLLLVRSALGKALIHPGVIAGWQGAALIGFLGGFAERLVETVFERTATGIENEAGTPVQRARSSKQATAVRGLGQS